MSSPGPHIISATRAVVTTRKLLAAGGAAGEIQKVDPSQHFHPKGKPPSEHTLKVLQKARDTMPFDDTRDFDEARKGFIAPLNSMIPLFFRSKSTLPHKPFTTWSPSWSRFCLRFCTAPFTSERFSSWKAME